MVFSHVIVVLVVEIAATVHSSLTISFSDAGYW